MPRSARKPVPSLPLARALLFCRAILPAAVVALTHSAAVGALEVSSLGKTFEPEKSRVVIHQAEGSRGGSTSVRNVDTDRLEWKQAGYFQRNRDLGQVFTPDRDFVLESIVLRTGPSDAAVLAGMPGAKVFVQFFEVIGEPRINDNGTPPGTKAKHGFSTNHRCDDYIEGVKYESVRVVRGGVFPAIPPTRDAAGNPNGDDRGKLHFMRWRLTDEDRLTFRAGRRYAFMIGIEEPGPERGFTLANPNAAAVDAPPSLTDKHDRYPGGWGLRREGDGTVPPTMRPAPTPPADAALRAKLLAESLFAAEAGRFALAPTTDGYPDVDTYRDLQFYLEAAAPPSPGK